MTFDRLSRVARKPPRYVVWRLAQEAQRGAGRLVLRNVRHGRGRLSRERIVPGDATAALARTAASASSLLPVTAAVEAVRVDSVARVALADRVDCARQRVVELFGDDPVTLLSPVAWSADVHSGYDWPVGFYSALDYRNVDRPSDVKVAWELSRLRHLVTLAQGVVVLGEDGLISALEEDLVSWHETNPMGWSVNWTSAMEVALRAVNLIIVDALMLASERHWAKRALLVSSLYQHGWFLARNLEISDVNGNHFLADAVGLVWLGRYFNGVGESTRWLERGREMVLEASRDQVLADGLDHEGSLPYHVLVLEMFLTAFAADQDGLAAAKPAIVAMLEAACALTGPGGRVPNMGDDDGGRVLAFCDASSRDARRVLALGATLTGHRHAAFLAEAGPWDDALWLRGPRAVWEARSTAASGPIRRRFNAGGLLVLGEGLDRIVVDAGPVGFRGRGGHGHLDATSFEAVLGGRVAVRDSGTGGYTGDPRLREALRDADAHTAVLVDGLRYATLGGTERLWLVEGDSPPTIEKLKTDPGRHVASMSQVLPAAGGTATLRRRIEWTPGALQWCDEVAAPPGARVSHFVQLPRGCRLIEGRIVSESFEYLVDKPADAGLRLERVPWSECYGSVGEGVRAVVAYCAPQGPTRVEWAVRSAVY